VAIGGVAYTVKIICEPIYSVYPIHFLNQYGGFETKIFTKVSRKTVTSTKTDYGKQPFSVDADGIVSFHSDNGVFNEQRAVYSSQFEEKMVLNTDLLDDPEYTWLQELILSPMVYLEDAGSLFPIRITDTDYESKKVVNDGPTNLTINVQFGYKQNAQYR
jgi:hypothetical protein